METNEYEAIQLGASMYPLFTKGEITFSHVPSIKIPAISKALEVIGDCWTYVKFTGNDRNGEAVFCNTEWHQIYIPRAATKRRVFFDILVDGRIVECQPENHVFDEMKVVFKG